MLRTFVLYHISINYSTFFKEFKTFISRGNIFDMAVGLIIATAFNKIVTSLVNDIIMPLITWATGAASLNDLSVVLRVAEDGTALTWNYGNFLQTIIDFLIVAFSVFVMIKIVMNSQKKLKALAEDFVELNKKEIRAEKRQIREQAKRENKKFKELWQTHLEEKTRLEAEKKQLQEAEKAKQAEIDRLNNPTEQDLLKEIRDLLKAQNEHNQPIGKPKMKKAK